MTPRVAVVGSGYWGKNLVRNFHQLGALVGVVDTNSAAAEAIAGPLGVAVRELDDVLADSSVAAVAVAVPAALHAQVAEAALIAGKHVFVEKPLALDLADAERLCKLAADRERVLMVGHLLQYHPAFLALRDLVHAGELGRVQYLYSNRLNLGRIRREEDILWSFAPHDISMILSLVNDEPDTVTAVGARYLHKSIADVTTTHLSFPGGERAHIFVSWLHPFKEQKLVVVGDRGMAVFDDGQPWTSKLAVYRHRIDWHDGMPAPVKADAEPIALDADEPLALECQHFLDCIENGSTPRTDGAEGVRVLRVLTQAGADLARDESLAQPSGSASSPSTHQGVFVHESAYIDDDCQVGEGTRVWHFSHLLAHTTVGADCTIGQNVMIGPNVRVGDRCKIQNNVSLFEGVTLDDGVFCGPSCVFTNVLTPRAEVERKDEFLPTTVGRGASIGANATIVCGNSIGAYAMIAAGAVVTSDVSDHALVVGVPARRIGWVSHDGEVLGRDLVCPRSGRRYRENGEELEEISP